MTNKQPPTPLPLERVIYEEAQELAKRRRWTTSYALSIMWSNFKSVGDVKEAEAAFILMQREEGRKGKEDPVFTEWCRMNRCSSKKSSIEAVYSTKRAQAF
jgi:hypothetical protein